MNYGYRWILTMPQIEIMQADLPHTLYNRRSGKKDGAADGFKYNPEDPAIAKTIEAMRRRKERMEKEGKEVEYTMDELFSK